MSTLMCSRLVTYKVLLSPIHANRTLFRRLSKKMDTIIVSKHDFSLGEKRNLALLPNSDSDPKLHVRPELGSEQSLVTNMSV